MQFLAEVGQFAIALTISGAVAAIVGPLYIAVAMLVLTSCVVLLLDTARRTGTPVNSVVVAGILGTSFTFGLIWPAIPLILTWKRAVDDE